MKKGREKRKKMYSKGRRELLYHAIKWKKQKIPQGIVFPSPPYKDLRCVQRKQPETDIEAAV